MADFSQAIHKALLNSLPQSKYLHCRFHFWNLINSKLKSNKLFPIRDLNPSNIPPRFLDYFNLKRQSKKDKHYDPRRIVRYDISILCKLPTETLFKKYFAIVSPFWMKYCNEFYKTFKSEYINSRAKNGWANYLSETMPKTNNNIEAYNRALKQTVTNSQSHSFSVYFQLLIDEIKSKSQEEAEHSRFPKMPYYSFDFFSLANLFAKNFDLLFVEYNGSYFIKDPSVNCSFQHSRKGEINSLLKRSLTKILNEEGSKNFLSKFSQPTLNEILDYVHCKPMIKYAFIQMAKIRRIDLLNPISEETPLLCIICSCPDFKDASFCLHTLAVLIKKGHLSQVSFEAQKRRGRKPQVPSAWTKDEVES